MKYKVLCLALCVAMLAGLIACTYLEGRFARKHPEMIEEPTPTEEMTPNATIKPTPTPQLNYAHDYEYEFVKCEINPEGAPDVKAVWKVDFPTETPDPSWTVESVDGDTVTYSMIECGHTPAPEETTAPEN